MLEELIKGNITEEDYFAFLCITKCFRSLPSHIEGFIFTHKNRNIIVINKNLSLQKQKLIVIHELAHLELYHTVWNKLKQNDEMILEFKIEDAEDEADWYVEKIVSKIKI